MVNEDRSALRAVAESLLRLDYQAWHFGDSVAFEGLLAAGAALGTSRYQAFAHGFARGWDARRVGFVPLDCTAPGSVLCAVAATTGDDHLLASAVDLAEYLCGRKKLSGAYRTWERSPLRRPFGPAELTLEEEGLLADPGPGVFVDCLHFDPPFFAALSSAAGDGRWLEEAVDQASAYVDLLQDDVTGLFHHFWLERTRSPHVLGWGRGQGWALLGLLDVVKHLPPSEERSRLAQSAARLVDAMVARQRTDGHWNPLVAVDADVPETSTAAFMAVGFRRALRLGLVPGSAAGEVSAAADSAHAAVAGMLDRHGVLPGVSAAVWACTTQDHYRHVPTGYVVPWGQGPVALMLAEGP